MTFYSRILVPFAFFALAGALLFAVFFQDIKGLGDSFHDGRGQPWYQSIKDSFDQRNDLLAGIQFMARHDPGLLNDSRFLEQTGEQFDRLNAGLLS